MKKITLFLALIFSVSLVFSQQNKPVNTQEDNPSARELYELNMLKNPKTGKIPENIREKELAYVLSEKSGLQNHLKSSNISWQQRGPWNVGGRTRAIAIDITNHNRIIAGGVSGGIWISNDGGSSWTKASIPETDNSPSVTTIAQDPSNPQIWYYAGGEYLGNSASSYDAGYRSGGIFKSTDGGNTWQLVFSTGDIAVFDRYLDYIYKIQVTQNGTVLVASFGGIFRSTDGGQSFSIVLNSDPNSDGSYSYTSDVVVAPNNVIYAVLDANGSNHGIFKSTDDGATWTNISPNSSSFADDYNRTVLAVAPSAPDTLYVLGYRNKDTIEHFILWMYDNNNGTWEDRSDNIPELGGKTGYFNSQGGYDLVIKVKPDDPNLVYIGGTNLFFSTNGFATNDKTYWAGGYTPTNDSYGLYTNHHPDQHSLAFDPQNPLILYSGHDGGISKTLNSTDIQTNSAGETIDWQSLDNGYLTTQAYAVDLEPTGTYPNALIAGFQDNGTWYTNSTNLQDNWDSYLSGDGGYCAIAPNKKFILVSSQKGSTYAYLFDNEGNYNGWAYASPNLSDPLFIAPFALDPSGNILYYLDGEVAYRNNDINTNLNNNISSNNSPAGWEELTSTTLNDGSFYTCLSVSTYPANILFLGTSDAKVYKLANANTGDPSAVDISGSNFPTNGYVSCIAPDPDNANNILVTFSNYGIPSVFYTSDGGNTWTDVSGNLEENPDGSGNGPSVRSAAILNFNGTKYYFVGTSTGLYYTTDITSGNWTQVAENTIGNTIVDMIKTRATDGTIAIATHGNGIFTGKILTSNLNTYSAQGLKIYPNPINTSKIAHVKLPEIGGKLLIYDLTGHLVYYSTPKEKQHTLYLKPLQTGTYTILYYLDDKVYSQKIIIK